MIIKIGHLKTFGMQLKLWKEEIYHPISIHKRREEKLQIQDSSIYLRKLKMSKINANHMIRENN